MEPDQTKLPSYEIESFFEIFRDEDTGEMRERLLFHIKSGDYFAVVATMLGFVEETLKKHAEGPLEEKEATLMRQLRDDLIYLHKNYRIEPKDIPAADEPTR